MSILCTGSIAIDQIMVFPDHFKNHILPEKIDSVNVSFYVPSLEKRYGGTGANIAYHVKILGIDPILLATVGSDFGTYAQWMDDHGIRRNWIKTLDDVYTAQCFIITDLDHNQINSFYPGPNHDLAERALGIGLPPTVAYGVNSAARVSDPVQDPRGSSQYILLYFEKKGICRNKLIETH